MLQSLHLYLSGSVFLVSFTNPNKQLINLKSVFVFLNCGPNVSDIYEFIKFLGIDLLFFIKQYPLKFIFGNDF